MESQRRNPDALKRLKRAIKRENDEILARYLLRKMNESRWKRRRKRKRKRRRRKGWWNLGREMVDIKLDGGS